MQTSVNHHQINAWNASLRASGAPMRFSQFCAPTPVTTDKGKSASLAQTTVEHVSPSTMALLAA